jgi:hypothetical protein
MKIAPNCTGQTRNSKAGKINETKRIDKNTKKLEKPIKNNDSITDFMQKINNLKEIIDFKVGDTLYVLYTYLATNDEEMDIFEGEYVNVVQPGIYFLTR